MYLYKEEIKKIYESKIQMQENMKYRIECGIAKSMNPSKRQKMNRSLIEQSINGIPQTDVK